ncbi:transglycosylase family protein [Frankia sp. CiP3]|uniref:transglycosylase family protein n=1 Tax=Frankia sp. CiP3 TaxID=2880971 RepID=UPI002104E89C|nr:transglycosylase family protein [Frankia sp. CiP3]
MSRSRARHRGSRATSKYTRALITIPAIAAAVGGVGIGISGPASAAPSEDQTLSAIAQCESGGNPTIVNSIGAGGLFQFLPSTWQSVGGTGLPQNASVAEQWNRARMLYAQQGTTPWVSSRSCWSGKVGSVANTAPTATQSPSASTHAQSTDTQAQPSDSPSQSADSQSLNVDTSAQPATTQTPPADSVGTGTGSESGTGSGNPAGNTSVATGRHRHSYRSPWYQNTQPTDD